MLRITVVAIVAITSVLGQARIGTAEPIRIVAERAAKRAALEASAEGLEFVQSQGQRRRSMPRTWGGIALMGLGATFIVAGTTATDENVCFDEFCIDFTLEPNRRSRAVGLGIGAPLLVTGTLLATVWSDVPVLNSVDFSVTPRGVQVGKTFGF